MRRTVRFVAILLLALVAIDLGAPSLCALDEQSATVAQLDGVETPPVAPSAPPAHVDDCFCCSHCVQPAAEQPPAGLTLLAESFAPRAIDRIFGTVGAPFHPPRS